MTFDPRAFEAKLASELGDMLSAAADEGGFDAAEFERKLADALREAASAWLATFDRDPVTLATQSMLMRPKDGSSAGILVTAINDPATGLMVAADIVPL